VIRKDCKQQIRNAGHIQTYFRVLQEAKCSDGQFCVQAPSLGNGCFTFSILFDCGAPSVCDEPNKVHIFRYSTERVGRRLLHSVQIHSRRNCSQEVPVRGRSPWSVAAE
jgi:hypothetical protein